MSLETLPIEVVVDQILSPQSNADLCSVRLVSSTLRRLADDSSIWRKRTERDFTLPLHSASRVSNWRALYASLASPASAISPFELWTCGSNSQGRLGVDVTRLPEELKLLLAQNQGAPFPLKVEWHKARLWNDKDDEWDRSDYRKTAGDAEEAQENRREDEELERKWERQKEKRRLRRLRGGNESEEDEYMLSEDEEGENEDGEEEDEEDDEWGETRSEKAERKMAEVWKSVQPQDVGHPIQLQAGGWMLAALTSTGNILGWGQLRTDDVSREWKAHASQPSVLGLGNEKAVAVTCGETLVVQTQYQMLWQWHHILSPVGLDDQYGMREDADFIPHLAYQMCLNRDITQLISGGDFTAILSPALHRVLGHSGRLRSPYDDPRTAPAPGDVDTGIYLWYTRWTESGLDGGCEDARALHEGFPGIYSDVLESCYHKSCYAIRLPDLPDPPADLAASLLRSEASGKRQAVSHSSHKYITRIAGSRWHKGRLRTH